MASSGNRPDQSCDRKPFAGWWPPWALSCGLALSLVGCATAGTCQRDLDAVRDELAAQRKANDEQRHSIDELRIRVEQLEARAARAQSPSSGDASASPLASLPVVRVQAPPTVLNGVVAPPVDTHVAVRDPSDGDLRALNQSGSSGADDQPVDLNAIIAQKSPAETAFATAVSFYNTGDWKDAIGSFRKFVARYPHHDLVPKALYLQGMSLVGLEEWAEASPYFERVIKAHPKSDSVAASLVGLARCELKLGHHEKARPLLQRVLSEFPGTAEASQAHAALDELGGTDRS